MTSRWSGGVEISENERIRGRQQAYSGATIRIVMKYVGFRKY